MAVLSHPDREFAVSFIHRGNAAPELGAVGVAFGQHALSQLDQEVNLLLGVLRSRVSTERRAQKCRNVRTSVCSHLSGHTELSVLVQQLLRLGHRCPWRRVSGQVVIT